MPDKYFLDKKDQFTLYDELWKMVPMPIILVRASDGVILNVNQKFLTCFDHPGFLMTGKKIDELDKWINSEKIREMMGRVKEEGLIENYELHILKNNGKYAFFHTAAYHVNMKEQDVIVFVFRDVSELKEAKESIRESNHLIQALFTHMPDLVIFHDGVKIMDTNDLIKESFGYNHDVRDMLLTDLIRQPGLKIGG